MIKFFNRSKLIKPFDLDQEKCRDMFNSTLPEKLMITISVLSNPLRANPGSDETYSEIQDALETLIRDCSGQAKQFGICAKLRLEHQFGCNVLAILTPLDSLQKQWVCRDMYVQVSVHADTYLLKSDPVPGTRIAMTFYDLGVARTNSLNPADHEMVLAYSESARYYRRMINNMYKKRIGIWTEKLVPYRNMIMVKVRALLAGLDPDQEYERFIQAGGKYCLEYPTLCP